MFGCHPSSNVRDTRINSRLDQSCAEVQLRVVRIEVWWDMTLNYAVGVIMQIVNNRCFGLWWTVHLDN